MSGLVNLVVQLEQSICYVCVCGWTIMFELSDVWPRYAACWFISTILPRSVLKVKIIRKIYGHTLQKRSLQLRVTAFWFLPTTTLARKIMQLPLSVRPSSSTLSFEPSYLWPWPFACVCVITITLLKLKNKVIGQGQTLKIKVRGRNAVSGTWMLNHVQFSNHQNPYTNNTLSCRLKP